MRFELENYKNVLLFDDIILFSNTFYQSSEHFKCRNKNSNKDELKKIRDLKSFEYNSIGNILTLKFKSDNRKLIFYSNERMNDFITHIKTDQFKLVSKIRMGNSKKNRLVLILFYFLICLMITGVIYYKYGAEGLLKKPIWIAFIIGSILSGKQKANSDIIKYKKTTANIGYK